MGCFAYTDESGNSGLKLFGSNQDVFWTGTLIAFADVDRKYKTFHQELIDRVGASELHGAELGFGGIEKIGSRLAWFIREKKLRFSFVRIFKPFLAAMKMFDLVFDAGNNPAVPPQAYWIRQLRLTSLLNFIPLLSTEDLNEFWDLFGARSPERFAKLLSTILGRVGDVPLDPRTKQIFGDVLDWGSKNPEAILDPFGKRDSPNFVAFTALFQHLHSFNKETGHSIECFVHDQQDQFVPSFKEAFEFLKRFQGELDDPFSTVADIKEMSTFDCQMEVRSSDSSFGLQLVDVCMWLCKRMIDQKNRPTGNCATLVGSIVKNAWITDYDFRALVERVRRGAEYVYNLPVTEEQLQGARGILEESERKRKARILEYENSKALGDSKVKQDAAPVPDQT